MTEAEAAERAASTSFVQALRQRLLRRPPTRDHTHAIVDGSRGERDDKAP
jgi:hypothetical protein